MRAHKAILKRGSRKKTRSLQRYRSTSGDRHDLDDHEDAARERARLMVTKRIKDVIAKIRVTHPELARHLDTSIRTGYTCTYVGDDEHPTNWVT